MPSQLKFILSEKNLKVLMPFCPRPRSSPNKIQSYSYSHPCFHVINLFSNCEPTCILKNKSLRVQDTYYIVYQTLKVKNKGKTFGFTFFYVQTSENVYECLPYDIYNRFLVAQHWPLRTCKRPCWCTP